MKVCLLVKLLKIFIPVAVGVVIPIVGAAFIVVDMTHDQNPAWVVIIVLSLTAWLSVVIKYMWDTHENYVQADIVRRFLVGKLREVHMLNSADVERFMEQCAHEPPNVSMSNQLNNVSFLIEDWKKNQLHYYEKINKHPYLSSTAKTAMMDIYSHLYSSIELINTEFRTHEEAALIYKKQYLMIKNADELKKSMSDPISPLYKAKQEVDFTVEGLKKQIEYEGPQINQLIDFLARFYEHQFNDHTITSSDKTLLESIESRIDEICI
tara:strand:+ start:123254 stop:124051 length:798 start_codon:yes stop_codon:yes gene_type:complete